MAVDRAALAKETAVLYALPAAEYTAARNARAKALRTSDRELAAAVAKLPKPSAAAAAANRLAREQPSEVRELIQAGKRLRQAQEAAVAGKAADLSTAVAEHRAALERVQREARRLRLSGAVLEQAVRTVRAASVDPELQPLLERALLAEEAEPAGFGLDPSLVPPGLVPRGKATRGKATHEKTAQKTTQGKTQPRKAPQGKTSASSSARKTAAARRRAEAEGRVRAAEEALAQAKRDARTAEQELARADNTAAAAGRGVEAAEAGLLEAREKVKRPSV